MNVFTTILKKTFEGHLTRSDTSQNLALMDNALQHQTVICLTISSNVYTTLYDTSKAHVINQLLNLVKGVVLQEKSVLIIIKLLSDECFPKTLKTTLLFQAQKYMLIFVLKNQMMEKVIKEQDNIQSLVTLSNYQL